MNKRKMGTRTGAGTEQERERGRGWRPADGHKMRTGTGAGTETRAVEEMEKGTMMGMGGMGTRTGLTEAEERRISAKNRTRVIDVMWKRGRLRWKEGKT